MNEDLLSELTRIQSTRKPGARTPLTGTVAALLREEFKPIEGLKPGDKVTIKHRFFEHYRFPRSGDVIEVFQVGQWPNNGDTGTPYTADQHDFTTAHLDVDGEIIVMTMDSRYFERVTE